MHKRLISGHIAATVLFAGLSNYAFGTSLPQERTLPAAAVTLSRNDAHATRIVVSTPELAKSCTLQPGESLQRPGLADEPVTVKPGWPELPMVSRLVLIPPTGGIRVAINHLNSHIEQGFKPFVSPVQAEGHGLDQSGEASPDYLNQHDFWPTDPVAVGEPAILRGYRMVQVTVYPMQVNPATGEVRYNDDVDFELSYEGRGTNEVINPGRPLHSATIERTIGSLVINPPAPTRDNALPTRGSYMLVYLNANGVAAALQPLIDWRSRQGWEVHAVGMAVNSSTAQIKTQIQNAYNQWTNPPEMLALVGDPLANQFGIPCWPANANGATDIEYAKLDGNDILADVDYGRITCRNIQELQRVVAKVVNYESDPWMQDTDWYHQGAVCAGYAGSGISTKFVSKWVRRETMDRGWTSVDPSYYDDLFQGMDTPAFFAHEFQRGINYITYRGWIGMQGLDANTIMGWQATRRYPYATTLTCASGDYGQGWCNTEAFFASAGGAIGSIGFATSSTHVPYNNAVFTGIWQGILKYNLWNLGTNSNYGRYNLYRQYNTFENDNVTNFSSWANLMADPATEMWTDIPQRINVAIPQTLPLGGSRVSIGVTDQGGNNPMPDMIVCLYKAGNQFQMVGLTDADGVAEFTIPPDALTGGNLLVTAWKHNVKPFLGQISVGQADLYIGASASSVENDNNGDGAANPGENFDLSVRLQNYGSSVPDSALTVTAESLSRWAQVTGAEVNVDHAPQPNESVNVSFAMQMNASAPDKAVIPIALYTHAGQTVWRSMAAVEVVAPKITVTRVILPNNRIDPGNPVNLDVTLKNTGHLGLPSSEVHVLSTDPVVQVINMARNYPAMAVSDTGRNVGGHFVVRANPMAIPGMQVKLLVSIESPAGFRDTNSVMVTVGSPRVIDPLGPDKYGYVCFDSGDTTWEMHPDYQWLEIDPRARQHDFVGTVLNISDNGEDADQSAVVDLPFDFQYYGQNQRQLTICTNGWAAFGSWPELADFRNRRIATAEGPDKKLSVFWDDLTTGRIVTYNDQEHGRFIVEWDSMHTLADQSMETFQLILYDVRSYATYSGDGIIGFQYKQVTNQGGGGPSNDTPYATVGIGNLDNTDGIEYTYYNTYPTAAKHLENHMALKFTTATQYITGILTGQVTDYATGLPIQGAQVLTSRGFWGETDSNGVYNINDILIGNYDQLTVHKQGYNDSTWTGDQGTGFTIREGDTLTENIALLHPEFSVDNEQFEFTMLRDSTTQTGFTLTNTGNGNLWFNSHYVYVVGDSQRVAPRAGEGGPLRRIGRDEPDAQWDPLLQWNASQPTHNSRIQCIAFVGDHWLVAGGHQNGVGTSLFYKFDRNGAFTGDTLVEPVGGNYGIRDMKYENGFLYGTFSDSSWIVRMDPTTGQELQFWRLPRGFNNPRGIAIDPVTGHFWSAGITSHIFELELVGDTATVALHDFNALDPRTNSPIRKYGLAWFRDDPDGFNLYIISDDRAQGNPNSPSVSVYKMNPATGECRYLTDLGITDPQTLGHCGIVITPKWNNLVWVLAAVFDNPVADQVKVYELAPNSSWVSYTPHSDTLVPGDQVPISITINTADLDSGSYGVVIRFDHNAGEGQTEIPIHLNLVKELPNGALSEQELQPLEYSLSPIWPNPFNSRATMAYSLREPGRVRIEVFDTNGRLVERLVDHSQAAGRYRISFDGAGLPAGLYFYRLHAGSFTATQKMLLVK